MSRRLYERALPEWLLAALNYESAPRVAPQQLSVAPRSPPWLLVAPRSAPQVSVRGRMLRAALEDIRMDIQNSLNEGVA